MNFGKNKNVFKFAPTNPALPDLSSAKNYIPDWYKSIKGSSKNNLQFDENDRLIKNVKACMPFLDTLTSGYMAELWCDVHFRIEDDKTGIHYVTWSSANPVPIAVRDPLDNNIPVPAGCEPTHYIWLVPYCFKTPKNYSMLLTHPLNRFDLPFITLSGIIDAENTLGIGNFPFFMKKDFEGVIEKGTPIFQMIPFKTENWISEKDESIIQEATNNQTRSSNSFFGYYKNSVWKKKKYE